jgi:DNA-binding GntR family transcriptional regulator
MAVDDEVWRVSNGTDLGSSQQLSHKVAAYIRDGIILGRLAAGEFLRTETLAKELNVSATPVREALMALQGEGTVRWEPRRGYRVVAVSSSDIRDIFQVQAYIAGELAARAAAVIGAETIAHLRSLEAMLEVAVERSDVPAVDRLSHEIHRTINKSSNSSRMAALLSQTVQYVPARFFGRVEGWLQVPAHDHAAIFDALEVRDQERARDAMLRHITHLGEQLIEHLEHQHSSPNTA